MFEPLDVYVSGRPIELVGQDLAQIDRVTSVAVLMGSPELIVAFNCTDRADVLHVVEHEIGRVAGIARVEFHMALNIRRYVSGYADLSAQ